jgi:hypothetical protein
VIHVSPHFTFAELTVTEHRDFLDEQDDAGPQVCANLVRLAVDLLEPARALVGPLRVNSGYLEGIAQSGLPVDQLIFEFSRWIHIGAARHGHEPRLQRLAIYEPGRYVAWSPVDPRFRPRTA